MQKETRNKQQLVYSAIAACALTAAGLSTAAFGADKPKPPAAKSKAEQKSATAATRSITEDDRILHVLNRLGFGPRPGDVEKVKAMGLQQYIDLQLNPERINDSVVDRKLASYTKLQVSDDELGEMFHSLQTATQNARALRKKLTPKTDNGQPNGVAAGNGAPMTDPNSPDAAPKVPKRPRVAMDADTQMEVRNVQQEVITAAMPVAQAHEQFVDAKVLRAVESERQLQEVLVDFWGNHFNIDTRKAPCGILKILDDREVIRPHVFGKFRDLLGASAKSPAMLVYLDNFRSTSDNLQMGQPLRNRRRLNVVGAAQGQAPAANAPAVPAKKRNMGLNENYAREIMELHTLGVDGGYTQNDVREVARCFTGWSVGVEGANRPGTGRYIKPGAFRFYPRLHDNGEKVVLGHVIPAGGGIQDGEKVLDILCSNPSTMRHVSYQLCQRLVSDTPPQSLIDKCVATWKRTDGDLREIVRTIATSTEFLSPSTYHNKIKSPFEYAVSSVRVLGGTYEAALDINRPQARKIAVGLIRPPQGGGFLDIDTTSMVGQIGTMGEPLFQYQAPTGYPEDSKKWVSSGALISRLNFSLALTNGKIADVNLTNLAQTLPPTRDASRLLDQLTSQILHGPIAPATRATLLKQIGDEQMSDKSTGGTTVLTADTTGPGANANRIAALLLGSPEFQRR